MKPFLPLALAALAIATPANAMFMMPQPAPVERLLKTAEKYLADHPDSTEARYILARIHYLAFARSSTTVPAFPERDGKPAIAPNWMINNRDAQGEKLAEKEMPTHASAALKGFKAVVEKEPANALYQLGLASLLEQIATWKKNAKPADLPADLKDVQLTQARDTYLKAHRAAWKDDSKKTEQPVSGIASLVSHEAGKAFVRLAADDASQAKDVAEVNDALKQLEALPMGAITPIIFSMHNHGEINGLLDETVVVDFDLRGYGPRHRSTWLQPTTALLVWDPAKQATITSGQQLFGGYTFQIFRNNGFEALAALDDDANGTLTGKELTGIRAWFDTNQDGQSSAAEVRDLADLGIAGITTQATTHDGRHPANPKGIILQNGSTRPLWDWIAQPVR